MIYAVLKIDACEVTNHFHHIFSKTRSYSYVVTMKLRTMSVFTDWTADSSVYSQTGGYH